MRDDIKLNEFLTSLRDQFLLSRSDMQELEDHVQLCVEEYERNGSSREEAVSLSLRDFGDGSQLLSEFGKLREGDKLGKLNNFLSYYIEPKIFSGMALAGVLGLLLFYGVVKMSGGDMVYYIQFKPLLFVSMMTALLTLLMQPWEKLRKRSLHANLYSLSRHASQTVIIVGFMGFVMGGISALVHLDSPEKIGPHVSFAIMSVFYASLLKIFVIDALKNSIFVPEGDVEESMQDSRSVVWLVGSLIASTSVLALSLEVYSDFMMFWDLISLVFVFGFSMCPLLIKYRFDASGMLSLLNGDEERDKARKVFMAMSHAALYSSLICTILGLVVVLTHLDDPAHIGPGLAVSFLSVLYGLWGFYVWQVFSMRYESFEKPTTHIKSESILA